LPPEAVSGFGDNLLGAPYQAKSGLMMAAIK
jgi:hypothetical protein